MGQATSAPNPVIATRWVFAMAMHAILPRPDPVVESFRAPYHRAYSQYMSQGDNPQLLSEAKARKERVEQAFNAGIPGNHI